MTTASEKRILVVDDEPDVRNFLAACLGDAGFRVETAVDGIEALEKVESFQPDLMTLDMVMPRKSGIRVMRTLRENEKWANLPVIVITAHAHDELGSEDIKAFNAFASGLRPRYTLEKPVTPASLIASICEILDVRPADADAVTPADDRDKLKSMIDKTDPDTLKKVRELLGSMA